MAEIDVGKHVVHMREDALSSWDDAQYLMKGGRVVFGLFAVHLALEK